MAKKKPNWRQRVEIALDRMAELYPGDGALQLATDPAALLDEVTDELMRLREPKYCGICGNQFEGGEMDA